MAIPGYPGDGQQLEIGTIFQEIYGYLPGPNEHVDVSNLFVNATGTFYQGYDNQPPYYIDKFKGYQHGQFVYLWVNASENYDFSQRTYYPTLHSSQVVTTDVSCMITYKVHNEWGGVSEEYLYQSLTIYNGYSSSTQGFPVSCNMDQWIEFFAKNPNPETGPGQTYSV